MAICFQIWRVLNTKYCEALGMVGWLLEHCIWLICFVFIVHVGINYFYGRNCDCDKNKEDITASYWWIHLLWVNICIYCLLFSCFLFTTVYLVSLSYSNSSSLFFNTIYLLGYISAVLCCLGYILLLMWLNMENLIATTLLTLMWPCVLLPVLLPFYLLGIFGFLTFWQSGLLVRTLATCFKV